MAKLAAKSRLKHLNLKRKAHRPAVGSAPGTFAEHSSATATIVTVSDITATGVVGKTLLEQDGLPQQPNDAKTVQWIDIQGLANTNLIGRIGEQLNIHPLAIADLVNLGQRPKAEIHDEFFIVFLREPRGGPPFDSEQIAIVAGKNFVLTVQERRGDIFDPVRARLQAGSKRVADMGAPYLAYALIDAIIDSYFPILEAYGELTEQLEEQVIEQPQPSLIADIHVLKRELLEMRRALWAQREAMNTLLRQEHELLPESLKVYFRDCSDHSFQLLDMVEVYREVAQGLVDLHLSSASNRMNEVMKILTVISVIFMPMTFIAGLYGMNFDTSSPFNMPELSWRFGYVASLLVMAASTVSLLIYFGRKGWIFRNRDDQ